MLKLNLQDAYFSVPFLRKSRKNSRFQWDGGLSEFVSLFWVGSSPSNLHKTPKSANIFDGENTDSSGDLFKRSLDHAGIPRGNNFRKGWVIFVLPRTNESNGILRVYHELRIDDYLSTPRESGKNNYSLRESPGNGASNYKRDDQLPRFIDFNLSSSFSRAIALPVTPNAADKELNGDKVLQNLNWTRGN